VRNQVILSAIAMSRGVRCIRRGREERSGAHSDGFTVSVGYDSAKAFGAAEKNHGG